MTDDQERKLDPQSELDRAIDEKTNEQVDADPPKRPAKILGHAFIMALLDAGVVDGNCRRVIVDAEVGRPVYLYKEEYGTESLLHIVPSMAETILREFVENEEGKIVEVTSADSQPPKRRNEEDGA